MAKFLDYCIVLFLLLPVFVCAQDKTPKYSNEFLALGVGARAQGLANVHSAIVNDVTSGYWNPAALLDTEENYQGSLMHAAYFAGIANYDYAGFSARIDTLSRLGLSIIRFGVDDIPDTRFLYDASGAINYDNIRFFSAADYAFIFSYARLLPKIHNLKLGGNMKVIHRKVGDFAYSWGFGIDFGAKINLDRWQLGVSYRDVFGTFNAWTHDPGLVEDVYIQTGNLIPENTVEITLPRLILGAGREFRIGERFGILPSIDLELTFDGKRNVPVKSDFISVDPRFGLEVDYKKIAFFRTGVGSFQQVKKFDGTDELSFTPAFGLGIQIGFLTVDYAMSDIGNQAESLYSHIFSLKASFD